MTTPPNQDAATVKAPRADRQQSIIDWFAINSRLLTIGAVVVLAAAAGYWFYARSATLKAQHAERQLMTAKQSLDRNPQLARSDLQKVVQGYGNTRAGVEATMLLAQSYYEESKYEDGIKVLQDALGRRSAAGMEPQIHGLIGDGYAQMKKLADAAKAYEQAAESTDMPAEKAYQQAKAARTYSQAGKVAEATRIWTALAESEIGGIASEARIRLAELTAQPAGKS